MTSLRTTNTLLGVIAACLVCLTAKTLIPEAKAQPPAAGNTFVSGCYKLNDYDKCAAEPIRVDNTGRLLVRMGN